MRKMIVNFVCSVLLTGPAFAGPGHDHGEAVAPAGPVLVIPKLVLESDLTELVAVVEGRQLRVYLDGWGDNRPVDASLNLELNGVAVPVKRLEAGLFEVSLGELSDQRRIGLVATVALKDEIDLLAGDLVMSQDSADVHGFHWQTYVLLALAVLCALVLLIFVARRIQKYRAEGATS
jgi:hypothetical protein